MKEKSIIPAATLLTSLLAYWYAKEQGRDTVPFVMLGGFVGSFIGEGIIDIINNHKSKQ